MKSGESRLSEETPKEKVKRPDVWSAPFESIEEPPDVELDADPLEPLAPNIGAAMAQAFQTPAMGVPLMQEPVVREGAPLRPASRLAPQSGVCPHGLAGLCVVCARYPCNYMAGRALRALIAKLEYGSE